MCVCLYLHTYDSYYYAISMSPLQAEFSQRSFASALGEWAPTGDRERDRDPVRLGAALPKKCTPKPISNTNETMVKTMVTMVKTMETMVKTMVKTMEGREFP